MIRSTCSKPDRSKGTGKGLKGFPQLTIALRHITYAFTVESIDLFDSGKKKFAVFRCRWTPGKKLRHILY